MNKKALIRFQKKIELDIISGCWLWKAHINHYGYGQFWLDGDHRKSHRVSYEHWNGKIPDGLDLDHLCRNRACCNPQHLEPVTRKENICRGMTGKHGKHSKGKHHWNYNPKLERVRR